MRVPRHALRRSRTYLHAVADTRRREIRMRSHFRRLIDPRALVFDIGASRGDWTAVFRSLGATVVAVEPVGETADELRRRLRNDAGVRVVEKAVTASTEPVTLHINAIPELCSISPGLDRGDGAERPVLKVGIPVGRAPYCAGNYGRSADRRVWTTTVLQDRRRGLRGRGAEGGATAPIDFLSLEFVAERTASALDCISRLERRGFRSYNLSYGDTFRFVRDEWLGRTAIEESLPALLTPGAWGDLYAAQEVSSPGA